MKLIGEIHTRLENLWDQKAKTLDDNSMGSSHRYEELHDLTTKIETLKWVLDNGK